jgi:DNA excision repair protein ERCC-6
LLPRSQLRLQEQLESVERETGAVAAALDVLQAPPARDGDAAEAPAPDASLRLAVGRTRLAGLQARREALVQALSAARAADKRAAEEAAAAAAAAAAARAAAGAMPPPPPRRPPSPRRAVLRDDDDFDAALGPIRGARRPTAPRAVQGSAGPTDASIAAAGGGGGFVETERDRLIRRGVLTPFAALDGFERRMQDSVASTVASARAAAASRPRTMLVDPSQLPRQHATPRDYQTPSAAAQRCVAEARVHCVLHVRVC